MKKCIVVLLLIENIFCINPIFAQTKKEKANITGCPTDKPKHHVVRHHHVYRKPKMHEETITVNTVSPITVVELNKGTVMANDSPVAKIVHPKYEDYHIVINYTAPPPPMNVINSNSFTGNNPERPRLGVYTCSDCDDGAMIEDLVPCGPAEKSGLRPGDVITGIDDKTVTSKSNLIDALSNYKDGDKVSVTYRS